MIDRLQEFFRNLPWQAVFAAFLGIFFLRNALVPMVADDYSYAFIWDGDERGNLIDGLDRSRLQRVESFGDIIQSQISHYFTWGGRSIAHVFVQLFILQGLWFFDAANTLVFAALVLLIFKAGTNLQFREMNKIFLLFILAGIYFCLPRPIITIIWLTGACNYLWMSTLIVLFLLPFALKYRRENFWRTPPPWSVPIMAFSGLLAGWSIEPGAATVVPVTFVFVMHFRAQKNLQPWMKIGFVFAIIGAAILFLSPGNFHRLELTNRFEPDELVPPEAQWTPEMLFVNFFVGFLPDFLREMILFVPIAIYFARGRTSPQNVKFILTFAIASMLSLSIMMFSPEFPERAGFPSVIFLLIASLAAFKEILPDVKNFCRRRLKFAMTAATIFAVFWLANIAGCIYVEYDIYRQFEARDKIIAEHKGDDPIKVPPLKISPDIEKFLLSRTWEGIVLELGGDFDSTVDGNRNLTFARYHGLKNIELEKNSE